VKTFNLVAATAALASACVLPPVASAQAQSSGASPVPPLQPFTAPDRSASVGVPPGWKVTRSAETVIQLEGPAGETIFLGHTAIAHDGPYQAGHSTGAGLSMPYSWPLTRKLAAILESESARSIQHARNISVVSATPIQAPPMFGDCARMVVKFTGAHGPMIFATKLCSLPRDSAGYYKNFFLAAQAPADVAEREGALAHAVFASYQVPAPLRQRILAPYTPAPVQVPSVPVQPGAAPAMPSAPGIDTAAKFDCEVIREGTYLPNGQCLNFR